MSTNTTKAPSATSLALWLAVVDPSTSLLNALLLLFPHIAILALLGASGAWWGSLAFLIVLLYGFRRERRRVTDQLLRHMVLSPSGRAETALKAADEPKAPTPPEAQP